MDNENVVNVEVPNFGGNPIEKQNFFRVDALEFVKGLDLKLGTTDDPNYGHFKQFADEMKRANVEIIQLDEIASEPQSYGNIDLTGTDEYVSFFGNGNLLDFVLEVCDGITKVCNKESYNIYTTKFNNDGYATPTKSYGLIDVMNSRIIMEKNTKEY